MTDKELQDEFLEQLLGINGNVAIDPTPLDSNTLSAIDVEIATPFATINDAPIVMGDKGIWAENFVDEDAVMIAGTEANPAPQKSFIYAIDGKPVTKEVWEAEQARQIANQPTV